MGNCNSCHSNGQCSGEDRAGCSSSSSPNRIKRVIGVMSGKGGVGKSTVTALLANALAKKGYRVGVLDADVTGPSIPRLLGVVQEKMQSDGTLMIPIIAENGIKVVSLNLILEQEDSPVIWRGPIITNTVLQFWKEVLWGELDFLLIDMPPGTGDVTLTVLQSIPVDGMLMVSLPQDMVSMIVGKAINMVKKMNGTILGVVENMSFLTCPDCGKKVFLFNNEKREHTLKDWGVPLLAQLPMSLTLGAFSGKGIAEVSQEVDSEIDLLMETLVKNLPIS